MIQAYFGLKKLPFAKEIKTDQMLETFDTKETFTRLSYIRQNRGIFCLTGEPGSGKTSILRKFVESLNPQTHTHCYTPHTTISRSELYRQLNSLLNLPPKVRKSDLFEQIQRAILDLYQNQGKTPVIILDECHLMDHQTLQELVLMTNFHMDSKVPFILVLVGQVELRETLKRRIHEPLNQRITLRYHMAGLSSDETPRYIEHQMKLAGRKDPLLEDQATKMIHQLSHGLPRKVANLTLASMTVAAVKQKNLIDTDCVIQASAGV
jgi:general secretion pathway protein A